MPEPLFDLTDIRRAFEALAAKLERRRIIGHVHVYGGAAMILAYDPNRTATRDIAQFSPDGPMIADPELASKYLLSAALARKSKRVEKFAAKMRAGQWVDRPDDPITIMSKTRRLADGKHRMHAIIASGCTIRLWVREHRRGLARPA
jgi:hypothetical protein